MIQHSPTYLEFVSLYSHSNSYYNITVARKTSTAKENNMKSFKTIARVGSTTETELSRVYMLNHGMHGTS